MGGLVKPTVVNGVYQSQMMSGTFENYVFVTIMLPFDLTEFHRSLAKQLREQQNKKLGMKKSAMTGFEDLTKTSSSGRSLS
jgi:hypothetical protein